MNVKISQSRDEKAPSAIDPPRTEWNSEGTFGPDPFDPVALHDDRLAWKKRICGFDQYVCANDCHS